MDESGFKTYSDTQFLRITVCPSTSCINCETRVASFMSKQYNIAFEQIRMCNCAYSFFNPGRNLRMEVCRIGHDEPPGRLQRIMVHMLLIEHSSYLLQL